MDLSEATRLPDAAAASFHLSKSDERWVRLKWGKIRVSQQKADEAGNEWNAINEAIKVKFRREDARRRDRGDFPMTDLMKAQAKNASLPLKDALETGKWHAAEAQRHIDDVMLFLRLKELGVL